MTSAQWSGFFLGLATALMPLSGLTCLAGCAQLDTGPKLAGQVADVSKTLALAAIDGMQAREAMVSVAGSVNDPRYLMRVAAGPVWYMEVELSLTGVALRGDVAATMMRRIEADPTLRADLTAILTRTETDSAAKRDEIMALLRQVLAGVPPIVQPATDPP